LAACSNLSVVSGLAYCKSAVRFGLIDPDQLGETSLVTHPRVVIHRIPITRARINLGQVARRAHIHKGYFILEKDGIPVAAFMNVEELENYLELKNPALKKQLRKSYDEYRRGKARGAGKFFRGTKSQFRKACKVGV
jgi:hypothetical protein